MNIFSTEYSKKLSSLTFYDNSKREYKTIVSLLQEVIDLPLQIATNLQHPEVHAISELDLSTFMIPSTQEDFKNSYIELIQLFAQRFAPQLQMRVGRQVLSLRLTEESMQRAQRIASVYQDDQYWNQYFNEKYPRMSTIVSAYQNMKLHIDALSSNPSSFVEVAEARGHSYLHFKISDETIARLTSNLYSDVGRMDMLQKLKLPEIIPNIFSYTSHALFLSEMYDGLKVEMDAQVASFYTQTETTRQAQFRIFEEWYQTNKVFSREQVREMYEEAGLFMEEKGLESISYPLETAPRVPIGAELYLYESKENADTWFANIISPVVDPPLIDGYQDPVIGKVTGYGEGNVIIINEFFNVEMNMDLFKTTFSQYSPSYDMNRVLTGDEQAVIDMIASVRQVTPDVASVELVDHVKEQVAEKTSISLEDLLARHGIVPQQQVQVEPTAQPMEQAPEAPTIQADALRVLPNGFRVTQTGASEFGLTTASGLQLRLSGAELATELRRHGHIGGGPSVINIDKDTTHMASLTEPFVQMASYLVM